MYQINYNYFTFYLKSRRKVVLEKPKFHRGLGVFENTKHHNTQKSLVEVS